MIVRTARFAIKTGLEDSTVPLLQSQLRFIESFPGCRRAYLGTPIHGKDFLLYSEWDTRDDVERLDAALRGDSNSSRDFFALLGRLAAPPHIAQYELG